MLVFVVKWWVSCTSRQVMADWKPTFPQKDLSQSQPTTQTKHQPFSEIFFYIQMEPHALTPSALLYIKHLTTLHCSALFGPDLFKCFTKLWVHWGGVIKNISCFFSLWPAVGVTHVDEWIGPEVNDHRLHTEKGNRNWGSFRQTRRVGSWTALPSKIIRSFRGDVELDIHLAFLWSLLAWVVKKHFTSIFIWYVDKLCVCLCVCVLFEPLHYILKIHMTQYFIMNECFVLLGF